MKVPRLEERGTFTEMTSEGSAVALIMPAIAQIAKHPTGRSPIEA